MKNKIWLSSPHMGGKEMKYVQEAFDQNWIAPLGPNVNGFESELAVYLGNTHHVAALSSGTSAIHLALIMAGVELGDEVLCQSFTFSATVNPIRYQQAIPLFIDSETKTWNMCPELLEEVILERIKLGKKPKACIVVHLYGMPAQIDRIASICRLYDIVLIEDAAEALGSTYQGKALGTWGDFGILSFNGNKIITTSGGGALVSADPSKIEYARFLATQARDNAPHYQHSVVGYNYRMSNVLAGIGRGQLEVLDRWVELRRRNYAYYQENLRKLPITFLNEPEGFFSNRWLSCVLFEDYRSREKARLVLAEENIESRPLWKPMHLQPIFDTFPSYMREISNDLFERGLCLPSGSNLEEEDLVRIREVLEHVFK